MAFIHVERRVFFRPLHAKVDPTSSLGKDLVFLAEGSGIDYVTGTPCSFIGNAVRSYVAKEGQVAESFSINNDGMYWQLPLSSPLYEQEKKSTWAIRAQWAAQHNWHAFLACPYDTDSPWDRPWIGVGITRPSGLTKIRYVVAANSSTLQTVDSNTGLLSAVPSPWFDLHVTRDTNTFRFYRDGVLNRQRSASPSAPLFGTLARRTPIHMGNRSHADPDEGAEGYYAWGAVWNRPLEDSEYRRFRTNPWQVLIAAPTYFLPIAAAAAAVTRREAMAPGAGFINETGTLEAMAPGAGFINETAAAAAAATGISIPVAMANYRRMRQRA